MSWIDREPRSLFIDGKAMVTGIGFRSEFLISKLAGGVTGKGLARLLLGPCHHGALDSGYGWRQRV